MKYPALMAYIADRSEIADWCTKLREDQAEAGRGGLVEIATELAQAQSDYGKYPYNSAMGKFLGLPIRANGEPPHGYYMASCVMHHYRAGEAQREVERLIAEGRELSIVVARSKDDRKPVRFARFRGAQIAIAGGGVVVNDGKRRITLSSNWSTETCLEAVAKAMRSGVAYGT